MQMHVLYADMPWWEKLKNGIFTLVRALWDPVLNAYFCIFRPSRAYLHICAYFGEFCIFLPKFEHILAFFAKFYKNWSKFENFLELFCQKNFNKNFLKKFFLEIFW